MTRALSSAVVLLAVGCSSEDVTQACALEHRNGTYLLHLTVRDGNCPPVPDSVNRMGPTLNSAGNDCALDVDDDLSDDECSLTRSATCPSDDGGSASTVSVTTEHDGGAKVTGLITVTLRNDSGEVVCTGTYDATFTRQ